MAWIEANVVTNEQSIGTSTCMSGSCQVPYPVLYICILVHDNTVHV